MSADRDRNVRHREERDRVALLTSDSASLAPAAMEMPFPPSAAVTSAWRGLIRIGQDRIADKWMVLIIRRLSGGKHRFAQLRRAIDGISQKVLTNTLRGLERDGIVTRRIYASVPPRVEYSLTDLGYSLCDLVAGICGWAEANIERVQKARAVYDRTSREDVVSG